MGARFPELCSPLLIRSDCVLGQLQSCAFELQAGTCQWASVCFDSRTRVLLCTKLNMRPQTSHTVSEYVLKLLSHTFRLFTQETYPSHENYWSNFFRSTATSSCASGACEDAHGGCPGSCSRCMPRQRQTRHGKQKQPIAEH